MNLTIRPLATAAACLFLFVFTFAQPNTDQPILFVADRIGRTEAYLMNPDGSNLRRLSFGLPTGSFGATPPGNVISAKWSPNGRQIVLSRIVNGPSPGINSEVIVLMNADGSNPVSITSGRQPALSPDGQKIIFADCPGSCRLFTINPDGTGRTELPIADFGDAPSYSPDGSKILFRCYANSAMGSGICTTNPDGSNRQILAPFSSVDADPVFSPDGTKIAFSRWNGTTDVFNIYLMNADGSGITNVTNSTTKCFNPAWSPDGSSLAYARLTATANSSYEVFTIGANGQNNTPITQNSTVDYAPDWRPVPKQTIRTRFDFDADIRANISVFRPSNNTWYVQNDVTGYSVLTWGEAGDKLVPADYDGDRKTDIAVWRPSNGTWYFFNSATQTFRVESWGVNGDAALPADHNGDGKSDLAIYRPSTGSWYLLNSNSSGGYDRGSYGVYSWGTTGDQPLIGDFDGDQRADLVVLRPSTNTWYFRYSAFPTAFSNIPFGQAGDIAVPADYDGDAITDIAVWRPTTGEWFVKFSSNGSLGVDTWGATGDKPVPADYDGDGKAEMAVFRPSNSTWYTLGFDHRISFRQFGEITDTPVESAFVQ